MDSADLDIARLQRMVMDMWRTGEGDTLVKVMPRGLTPNAAFDIGYVTTIKFIIGRTPREMEDNLGFRADTKLKDGADVYLVDPLPSENLFEFRGYSHLPAGVPQVDGKVVHPDYPPGCGVPQWELVGYPQSGLTFLASVLPEERFRYRYDDLPPAPRAFFIGTGR